MSFDLSSIVRTRRKNFFLLLIFTLLFFGPLFPPSGVQASESTISSVASPNSVGRAATSEENIDSFDVHPANRWTESSSGWTTDVIENGYYRMADIGDGSSDYISIVRDLRDLSGTVEIRFQFYSDSASATSNEILQLLFYESTTARYCGLEIGGPDKDDYCDYTVLKVTNAEDGTINSKALAGTEQIRTDKWYILRIDYDVLESKLRFRCYFDNSSKVFDYNWFDVNSDVPALFAGRGLYLRFITKSNTNGITITSILDYVNAPFKEQEWTHSVIGTDTDWLVDESWEGAKVQDAISVETQSWSLTVPRLDLVSGILRIEGKDWTNAIQNDYWGMVVYIYCVDANDGDLHEAFQFQVYFEDNPAETILLVQVDGVTIDSHTETDLTDLPTAWLSFAAVTNDDRSIMAARVIWGWDITDYTKVEEYVYDIPVSSVATDPSQEFVIVVSYIADFTGDMEFKGWIDDWSIIFRDRMSGMNLEDAIAKQPDDTGANRIPFVSDFMDWLNDIISDLGDFLSEAFEATFGSVISDLQSGLGGFFNALGDLVNGVVDWFVDAVADFLDAFVTWFGSVLGDIWGLIEGVIFFVWDALNLPDAIEIFDLILAYIVELVQWLVTTIQDVTQLTADLGWIILVAYFFWLFPVQFARAGGNPLAGLGNVIEVYFNDLIPWTFFGIHIYVPQGLVFTVWLILLLPANFVLFTALGI